MSTRHPVFKLVPDEISNDTVEALEALYKDAQKGSLIGLAFVGIYRSREYICNTAGFAYEQNTTAMGMVRMLALQLEERERGT
jgi:hypothetical protein